MAEKKYYWLKLKEDFFDDDTIEWIEDLENGHEYALFYLKLCLKSLRNDGILIRNVGDMLIPYDVKKLSEITRTDIDTVRVAMEIFKKTGLVQILENGEIYMAQLQNMVGSETSKAQLMRNKRARDKQKALEEPEEEPEIVDVEVVEEEPENADDEVIKEEPENAEGNIVTEMFPQRYTENRDKSLESRDKSLEIDKELDTHDELDNLKEINNNKKKSIKKSPAKVKSTAPTHADLLEWVGDYPKEFQEAFIEWAAMRKIIKKPIAGKRTVTRALNKLNELTRYISDSEKKIKTQIAILNQSTDNNWQDIYPLKAKQEPLPEPKKYNFRNTEPKNDD